MPRVSEAHLEARRRQILDAAQTCFIRNGFHATSMQDVIKEADLSIGAVYRYFASKNDLIRAISQDALGRVVDAVDEFTAPEPVPPLLDVVGRILDLIDQESEPETGLMRIAVQVWGESLRDPDLAGTVATIYGSIRQRWAAVAARARDAGQLAGDADPERVGGVLFGMILGYAVQRLLIGDPDRAGYLAGIRDLLVPTGPGRDGGPGA